MEKKTLIKTFDGDIYIISGRDTDEVNSILESSKRVRMPNGSYVASSSVSAVQSYEDYTFQVDQKNRHKKGQYIKRGEWHDQQGKLGVSAELERITGSIANKLSAGSKSISGHEE